MSWCVFGVSVALCLGLFFDWWFVSPEELAARDWAGCLAAGRVGTCCRTLGERPHDTDAYVAVFPL